MVELDEEQKERLSEFVSVLEKLMVSHGFALTFEGGRLFDTVKKVSFPCYMYSSQDLSNCLLSSFVLGGDL